MRTLLKNFLLHAALFLLPLLLFSNLVSATETRTLNYINIETVPTTSKQNVILIPFELIGNLIIVKAKVNEQEGNFVVDTGADIMVLHSRFFTKEYPSLDANSVSINDQTEEIKITQVHFKWMGISRKNQSARVVDLSLIEKSKGIDILGFIGYPILKDFEVLFDYEEKTLTLFKLNSKGNRLDKFYLTDEPTHQINLEMAYHFPYLTLQNGEESIHLLIDSGAEMNILSPQAEEKLTTSLEYVQTRHLIGFGQTRIPCKEYLVKNFKLEEMEWQGMHTLIQNMEGFNEFLEMDLDGFLGFEFLSQHKISINFQKRELLIWEQEVEERFEEDAVVLDDF